MDGRMENSVVYISKNGIGVWTAAMGGFGVYTDEDLNRIAHLSLEKLKVYLVTEPSSEDGQMRYCMPDSPVFSSHRSMLFHIGEEIVPEYGYVLAYPDRNWAVEKMVEEGQWNSNELAVLECEADVVIMTLPGFGPMFCAIDTSKSKEPEKVLRSFWLKGKVSKRAQWSLLTGFALCARIKPAMVVPEEIVLQELREI